jgi:hypothetical protein
MDAGNRAPTVGALGDAGAIAERVGVRRIKSITLIPLIPTFSLWRRSFETCLDTYASGEGFYFYDTLNS